MKLKSLIGSFFRYTKWGVSSIWFIIDAKKYGYDVILTYCCEKYTNNKFVLLFGSYQMSYSEFQKLQFSSKVREGEYITKIEDEYSIERSSKDLIRACL